MCVFFFHYRYAGEYEPDGRQFIIVCGNINYETVTTFLADFFHPSRQEDIIRGVVLFVFLNIEKSSLFIPKKIILSLASSD